MTVPIATVSTLSVIAGVLQVLGALGVFLYGMKVLSEAVQRVAGSRMRQALAHMTGNRFSGIFTGFLTTSLVQSSSATTVLVVSFVNAGLLTLVQAIPVIMGANLGTTVTAWIVAFVGKFSVSSVALPLVGIGLPFVFIGKDKAKNWGEMLLGFGFVFFGLGLLKDSVPDLQAMMNNPDDRATADIIKGIVEWMSGRGFFSTLLYLVGGLVLTLTVQSSSAAMAITIMCALNGWMGDLGDPLSVFRNSAAIVLGENIGTTVTAWLAALGANTAAKRAARAHFLFNVIGVVWMLVLFMPMTRMVWSFTEMLPEGIRAADNKVQASEIGFATAIFHSAFNLLNIILLVWFVPQIEGLVKIWVKDRADDDGKSHLKYISKGMVEMGELNVVEAEQATRRMHHLASEMLDGFIAVLRSPGSEFETEINELKKKEGECDVLLHEITTYLVLCSANEIGEANAAKVTAMLRTVSEYEEASDRIYRLLKLLLRKQREGIQFLEEHHKELESLCTHVRAILDLSGNSLSGVDGELIENANRTEDRIDRLRKQHNLGAMDRMRGGADVATEMLYTELNSHLEAIGNHALNIVQSAQIVQGGSEPILGDV